MTTMADFGAAVMATDLPLANKRNGKVRDVYDMRLPDGSDGVLIVATDRVSAFDVVLGNGLPGKGVMLTQISKFWFDYFDGQIVHHLVSTDAEQVPGLSAAQVEQMRGRVMICRKSEVVPIECVARGYLAGSGFKDYGETGSVCGIELPAGLRNGDQLPAPIFTPATKADTGHDENISFAAGAALIGEARMQWLSDTTLWLYGAAREYAAERGIILADTKFEFGVAAGGAQPILIDEIFTPDSSRFWPQDQWQPGREQDSFDKQIVRNYLEGVVAKGQWDKTPPGPMLPDDVMEKTLGRYLEAYERLTGKPFTM